MKSLALTLLIIGCLSGVGLPSDSISRQQTKPALTLADEDDIREAVFRFQFTHNNSGQQQNANFYFLSVGKDKDPDDAFMRRFDQNSPPVKKRSQAVGNGEVFDKDSGKRGVIFRIARIEQVTEDQALVDGGYFEADLSASGNTYTVERQDHKWMVTKAQMHWIS
ncbi:MAG TPA: hypothetical protein VE961_00880 [Pyrinomonadaceae bacterium]|nr:hypothetical protein [Pyrinomonadaceae bacterium]